MTATVRDARPPLALVRTGNIVLRRLLRTPLARPIRNLALIEVTGRRSGRRYRVPVGWHRIDPSDTALVFTPAPWRHNFAGGAAAVVHVGGRARPMRGTLVDDPNEVARLLATVLAAGSSPRSLGLDVPVGHLVTAADIARVGRSVVRFASAPAIPG